MSHQESLSQRLLWNLRSLCSSHPLLVIKKNPGLETLLRLAGIPMFNLSSKAPTQKQHSSMMKLFLCNHWLEQTHLHTPNILNGCVSIALTKSI